ncbi:hypothetical protein [Clostridium botulinum]|uniref:hypothetical protein n=1 Tax=Clostridium botulinum TaxID=1491 RepID=UPI00249ED160|nr:hypothetical protein [Clostridium botulinum]MDU4596489.1 hypothetical protein [Clostridium sporogenes]WGZ48122.1 hypothetical protein HEQ52_18420 [Clostridium botulinum]
MSGKLNIRVVKIEGVNAKTIDQMVEEVRNPSPMQKLSEEIYRLREKNEELENKVVMLRHEKEMLKKAVESSIGIIVGTAYENVNEEGKVKIDKFRKQAAEALKVSDLIGIFIGE